MHVAEVAHGARVGADVLAVPAVEVTEDRAVDVGSVLSEEESTAVVDELRERRHEAPHPRRLLLMRLDHVGVVEEQAVEPLSLERRRDAEDELPNPRASTFAYHSPHCFQ